MSDKEEANGTPYNKDGSTHECKKKNGNDNNDKALKFYSKNWYLLA
jgi:hypothetical protein